MATKRPPVAGPESKPAGGVLGIYLSDSPWPVTLGQVAFGTLVLMLGVLYTFMAKGWLW